MQYDLAGKLEVPGVGGHRIHPAVWIAVEQGEGRAGDLHPDTMALRERLAGWRQVEVEAIRTLRLQPGRFRPGLTASERAGRPGPPTATSHQVRHR